MANEAFRHIEALEAMGPVRAIYTLRDRDFWPCNEETCPEIYAELGNALAIGPERIVRIPQTHTANVRVIGPDHAGEGVTRAAAEGYDGMVTNEPGILLCTVEADCVPVYLYDPVKQAAAMIHSGWRGCAGGIVGNGVEALCRNFGSNPRDIAAALGPCICGRCYEVGGELKDDFAECFSEITDAIFTPGEDGKYYLDLPVAIKYDLERAGLSRERIFDSPACTYEDETLCSWRRDHDKQARMLTAIMLMK